MDILRIQDLIADGRITKLSDIDPTKAYLQYGLFQTGNRSSNSSNADAYKSYVIPLSELLGTGGNTDICNVDFIQGFTLDSPFLFNNPDNAELTDVIGPNVGLKRGSTGGALFNPFFEPSFGYGTSPVYTKWNASGWANLGDVRTRTYVDFVTALGGSVGTNILTTDLVMHDEYNDKYYTFKFSAWTSGGAGGGFTYTRTEIFPCGQINFQDGTTLSSAPVDKKKIIVVDNTFGNDSTALPYDMFKPFASVDAAIRVASNQDLIVLNPSTTPYAAFLPLFRANGISKNLNYFIHAGATFNSYNMSQIGNTTDITISGPGDLILWNSNLNTSYAGKLTIDVGNLTINGTMQFVGAWSAEVQIKVQKTLTLNSIIYYENSAHWATATTATKLKIEANEVVNNTILFVIYPGTVDLTMNINKYTSVSPSLITDVWCYGSGTPSYPVTCYINMNRAYRLSTSPRDFFTFVSSGIDHEVYITGDYTITRPDAPLGQLPATISLNSYLGKLTFDGVAKITNGSMLVDLNSTEARVKIAGKVYINNNASPFEWLYSAYFVSSCRLEIYADTIMETPNNHLLFIGDYSSSPNTAQVDVIGCELVSIDIFGLGALATVLKGGYAFGPGAGNWGKLRLKDAVIIGTSSILGVAVGEPVDIYTAYLNVAAVSVANTIVGTNFIVDSNVTSNNF